MAPWPAMAVALVALPGNSALRLERVQPGDWREHEGNQLAARGRAGEGAGEFLEAERLSRLLGQASRPSLLPQSDQKATLELLASFRLCSSLCRLAGDFQRFGEQRDGGYQMCIKPMGPIEAGFSLGVGSHDQWSLHIARRFNITVNQFDCTRVHPRAVCKRCHLYRECITSTEDLGSFRNAWTFSQMLENTGQNASKRGSLIMKMDIEGSEWNVLAEATKEQLQKFNQIVIEFHQLFREEKHAKYLAAVHRLLDAGFKVAHLHGNNQQIHNEDAMYRFGKYRIPNNIEVTFVLERGPQAACSSHIESFANEVEASNEYAPLPSSELPEPL